MQLRNSFLAVIVLIQILLITLSVFFQRIAVDVLEQAQAENLRLIKKNIQNSVIGGIESPKAALLSLSRNEAVTAAFAQRDREKLLKLTAPILEDLRSLGFKQLQFHVQSGISYVTFLRVHEPQKFGEDLAYRPMIFKTNSNRELVGGLEQGKSGYGFRVAMPLNYRDKPIGSMEIGYDFGLPFLEKMALNFPGSWAIYNLNRGVQSLDDRILMTALGKDKDGDFKNLPFPAPLMAKIGRGESHFERDRASKTGSLYIPVVNYRGDIVIVLKYVFHTDYFDRIHSIILTAVLICLLGLALSGLIIYFLNRLISVPMRRLVIETEKIRSFQLDEEINFRSSLKEINELIESTRSMKKGLQSFRKYVPAQLVRQLIDTKQEAVIGGQRRDITVLFADVADFTTISESLTPNELAEQLSEYLSLMTDTIIKHQGTVDKYIGDAVMAFWGAPIELKNHAELACQAALECQKLLKELNLRWKKEGKSPFITRIGINSGEIVVGNMGSSQRLNYTIIGDEVNLASRLEGLNKVYGTHCIVSESTARQLSQSYAMRLLDFVVVKGKLKPVSIFELAAEKNDVRSVDLEFLKGFNEAVAHYQARSWDAAIGIFEDLLKLNPDDKACALLLKRSLAYRMNPPPQKWRGEFVYEEKRAA